MTNFKKKKIFFVVVFGLTSQMGCGLEERSADHCLHVGCGLEERCAHHCLRVGCGLEGGLWTIADLYCDLAYGR